MVVRPKTEWDTKTCSILLQYSICKAGCLVSRLLRFHQRLGHVHGLYLDHPSFPHLVISFWDVWVQVGLLIRLLSYHIIILLGALLCLQISEFFLALFLFSYSVFLSPFALHNWDPFLKGVYCSLLLCHHPLCIVACTSQLLIFRALQIVMYLMLVLVHG